MLFQELIILYKFNQTIFRKTKKSFFFHVQGVFSHTHMQHAFLFSILNAKIAKQLHILMRYQPKNADWEKKLKQKRKKVVTQHGTSFIVSIPTYEISTYEKMISTKVYFCINMDESTFLLIRKKIHMLICYDHENTDWQKKKTNKTESFHPTRNYK